MKLDYYSLKSFFIVSLFYFLQSIINIPYISFIIGIILGMYIFKNFEIK